MKQLLVFTFLIQTLISQGQEKMTFTILDQSDNTPIEFVNVINLSSRQFYYSDADGKANVIAKPSDSLLITQMGYLEIRDLVINIKPRVVLQPNVSQLDEVVLVDRSKNELLHKNISSKLDYSINTALICVFKCELEEKSLINKIVLPVIIKKRHEDTGELRFQLYRTFEDGRLQDPLTQVFVFNELEKIEDNIVLEFSDVEVGEEFYISATRNRNNTRQVSSGAFNPFLKFGKSQNSDDLKYRHILSSRWFNLSWALSDDSKYKLVFEAYGRPIKN